MIFTYIMKYSEPSSEFQMEVYVPSQDIFNSTRIGCTMDE